ncbi:MAG: hypothetical protein A2275_18935 [Bacteroidetes bacterium RIFOXYA12_FULL_35_11]|nr:MAG: hypothetical protein A2X01_12770 [Bacteroidetes bacterium GWF2_35_48]OFY78843.1 MAG: hypothetical protein A2275_18935 [Bacteroidetes bacterium RIFOXYA12_FULL_35_11]OFZ06545.1 MAG: hypothetical protein A2491_10515 [Bacteroidetes bacterium RIFOXYC12_FULL_35_7]
MEIFRNWLLEIGVPAKIVHFAEFGILIGVLIVLSIIANFLAKKIILSVVRALVKKSKNKWDDILLERKVFHRLSHFAPALIIYTFSYILSDYPMWMALVQKGSYLYMIIISMLIITSFINGMHDIYQTHEISKNRSIKGYLQVVKIIIYVITAIVIIATLMGRSPFYMLSGLGAFTAILMLIFQDSIKGLIGGIQLSANDMVRLGDWITAPKHDIDGSVVEINLNTIRIQNPDMTFSSIPTYALVNDTFSNFRGVTEADGRRIKRSINIDVNSIKLCNSEMLQKFEKINILKDFIALVIKDIDAYSNVSADAKESLLNGKNISNLRVFRKYVEVYLKNHNLINPEMMFLVRYLEPTPNGLPLDIWVFCVNKDLVNFEAVQSEIFEHILSVIREFDLKVFQAPTGNDIMEAKKRI